MSPQVSRRTFVSVTTGAALGSALLSVAGCAPSAAPAAKSAATEPVKFRWGEVASASGFPREVAVQQGYLSKRGLQLEKAPYATFDALYAAYRSNEVDGGDGGIASVVDLRAKGTPILVVFGSNLFTNDVLVLKDSPIQSYSDLKGKKIGSFGGAAGTSANMFLSVCRAYFGFDPVTEASVQYGAPPLMAGLVQKGELDAFLSIDPVATNMLASGKFRTIGDIGDIYRDRTGEAPIVGGLTFTQSFAERRPEAVSGYIEAYIEGIKYLDANPAAWLQQGKTLGVDDEAAGKLLMERSKGRFPLQCNVACVAAQIRVLEFIQQHAGRTFLETIDPATFTTRYAPRST
jgi:ABC-type nitrate/sulfonate/bicarbonate transport system substrate-binding protein